MSLSEVKENGEALVSGVNGDTRFMSRITSIGLTPGSAPCKGCLPEGGFKNMGEMWEVVKKEQEEKGS